MEEEDATIARKCWPETVVSLLLRWCDVRASGGISKAEHGVRGRFKGGYGILEIRSVLDQLSKRNLTTNLVLVLG